ncbi:hypothetical protein D9757_013415 [Collybiopsis confluens]|uniref:Protein kinase domain-containing protein n=1 Tax=Collybiopsis confluens TaxID=2823264 RepID=A0A8H5FT75_9AGAR|nr:hypothetical protein D9757_013415 [Collybiopsis confluens]
MTSTSDGEDIDPLFYSPSPTAMSPKALPRAPSTSSSSPAPSPVAGPSATSSPQSYYSFIFEFGGTLVHFDSIPKSEVAEENRIIMRAIPNVIVPLMRKHDPRIVDPPARTHTKVFTITYEAHNTLGFQVGRKTNLNLTSSERFQLSLGHTMPDYMLVIYQKPDDAPTSEPFFLDEPSLATLGHLLPPDANHYLYPSFIKATSGTGFNHKDITLNKIFKHGPPASSDPNKAIPTHVTHIWNKLSQRRVLTANRHSDFLTELEKIGVPDSVGSNLLAELFTTVPGDETEPGTSRNQQEYTHYAFIVTQDPLTNPISKITKRLSLERLGEYFFFSRLTVFIQGFASYLDTIDKNHAMPIARLVVERTDATGQRRRFAPYPPKSDFGVWLHVAPWPFLLVELQSGNRASNKIHLSEDHIRMLLQGGSLVRMMNIARKLENLEQETAVLPLIYKTRDWTAGALLLLFALGDEIHYLERKYDLSESLEQRLRFTRDLYNLFDWMEESVPSAVLQQRWEAIDSALTDLSHLGSRLDTKEDREAKRKADQAPDGEDKRGKRTHGQQGQERKHDAFIAEAERQGYQFERIKSSGVYVGQSPEGSAVVAKRILADSGERNILLKLQSTHGSERYVLPIINDFVISTSTNSYHYFVFPRWVPLNGVAECSPASAELLGLCSSLASGLCFLHNNLIAHLDIKPPNLVVQRCARGKLELRIIDFNISVAVGSREEKITSHSGTPGYMAPEVSEEDSGGYLPLKADLYSCGRVILLLSCAMNDKDSRKAMGWGHVLIQKDPNLRPDMSTIPGLLPEVTSYLEYPPSYVQLQNVEESVMSPDVSNKGRGASNKGHGGSLFKSLVVSNRDPVALTSGWFAQEFERSFAGSIQT